MPFDFYPAYLRQIKLGRLLWKVTESSNRTREESGSKFVVCCVVFLLPQVESQRYRERTHPAKNNLASDQWGPAKISCHHAGDDSGVLQRFYFKKVEGKVNLGLTSFLLFYSVFRDF